MKKILLFCLSFFLFAFAQQTCFAQQRVNVERIPTNTPGDKVLTELFTKYKGKVVLFDFWATWCPPCKKAIQEIEAIKPQLQERGVVFVYLTGESSPLDIWETMIKNIPGDHFRLTAAQWNFLGDYLGMRGIPAYMILNKEGQITFSNTKEGGYPGNEIIEKELVKNLK